MLQAQEHDISHSFSAGLQLNEYQQDFGTGLHITTPYFANDRLAVRTRGNVMFHQHPEGNETTWTPHGNLSVGLVGVTGIVSDFIRLFAEGGAIGIFPSDKFSSHGFDFGGYGIFGFEFFMSEKQNYFIELGATGTGAKANKIPQSPIYSNGFLISTGFRTHF